MIFMFVALQPLQATAFTITGIHVALKKYKGLNDSYEYLFLVLKT